MHKGVRPGQIPGHPALDRDGNLPVAATVELQEELMAEYAKEEFQMRLYAGWYATDELVEKHKWRQMVCGEVQYRILPQYGFEASRTGVWASMKAVQTPAHHASEEGGRNYRIMEWLVNPDVQQSGCPFELLPTNYHYIPSPLEGERPDSGYSVHLTDLDDEHAIVGVARCQGALAGAHQALYRSLYPDMEQTSWFPVLGCSGVRDALERGVIVYHALSADTRFVAGFISCTCNYSGTEGEKPHAKINNLVVLSQHRGHGVGKMLWDELMAHLSEACPSVAVDLRISVAESNSRAKEWYGRLGFVPHREWTATPSGKKVVFLDMRRCMNSEDFDDLWGT